MYPITYYGIEQQPNLYARVQRLLDGKWWDQINSVWIDTATAPCNIALIETGTVPGEYVGEAGFSTAASGVHTITVYDNAGAMMTSNNVVSKPNQMTALQIINEVQRQLRLPQSVLITEPHAQLLLSFINEVQVDYMMEFVTWDELKVDGAFSTKQGVSVYVVAPVNAGKVDLIRNLQISGSDSLTNLDDEKFRYCRTLNTAPGQPEIYRHFGRSGGGIIIEVAPIPDQAYRITFELFQKPDRLELAGDIPALDQDTIILGVKYLAKKDQGDEFQAELATFNAKLSLQGGSQSASNWGDVEFL